MHPKMCIINSYFSSKQLFRENSIIYYNVSIAIFIP